jgi:hypothetical protein
LTSAVRERGRQRGIERQLIEREVARVRDDEAVVVQHEGDHIARAAQQPVGQRRRVLVLLIRPFVVVAAGA